jgi:hypothetical protein
MSKRILARSVARELTAEEISAVSGGTTATPVKRRTNISPRGDLETVHVSDN